MNIINKIRKSYLITKGELPESAGGSKISLQEKILFIAIICILIIIIIIFFKFL